MENDVRKDEFAWSQVERLRKEVEELRRHYTASLGYSIASCLLVLIGVLLILLNRTIGSIATALFVITSLSMWHATYDKFNRVQLGERQVEIATEAARRLALKTFTASKTSKESKEIV